MISEFELSRRPGSSTTERHAYPAATYTSHHGGEVAFDNTATFNCLAFLGVSCGLEAHTSAGVERLTLQSSLVDFISIGYA